VSNFIDAFLDYAQDVTDAPKEFLKFGALMLISSVLEKKVFLRFGDKRLYPNLWVLFIAPSSLFRKSTSISIVKNLLVRINEGKYILPNEFTPEALLEILAKENAGTIFWSEFAMVLNSFERKYMLGMKELLTDLFDCPEVYVRKIKGKNCRVEEPFLNILSASSTEWFTDKLKIGDIKGGFLNRFVIIPVSNLGDLKAIPISETASKKNSLLRWLNKIFKYEGEMKIINKNIYEDWYHDISKSVMQHELSDILSSYFVRLAVYTLKFAILLELSKSDCSNEISNESLSKAIKLSEFLFSKFQTLLNEELLSSKFSKVKERIFKFIKSSKDGRIKKSELLRKSHLRSKELKEILDNLWLERRITISDREVIAKDEMDE